MSTKISSLKEKMRHALNSTMRAISEDLKVINEKPKSVEKGTELLTIDNFTNPKDFVRLRAEFDSKALEKKFSNKEIFNINLPNNSSCRSLYTTAEKTRYELLGSRMLKGIEKNLNQNHLKLLLLLNLKQF